MKILIISRYKSFYADHQLPFVTEQGEAIANELRKFENRERRVKIDELSTVEFFLMEGDYWQQYKSLRQKIKEYRPDIIHAHYGLTAIVAELQKNVPVVTTFHNGETLRPIVNFASSLMSLRANYVIYVAQHIRELSYFKAKNCSIIPCGVPKEQMIITPKEEARKQLGWSEDKKYILFGGAFDDERKNYALLRDAVERIRGLAISGLEDIECVEMYKLSRAECVLRMNACNLFALPSHSEGSPQALKEAMAVNCPCLATDIADVRELFGDEPGHWILRNPRKTHERWDGDENSLDDMVELLKEALMFKGRTNGRKQIEKLGLFNDQVAKKIVEIYRSILK